MTQVWVVTVGAYSDIEVVAATTDQERADQVAALYGGEAVGPLPLWEEGDELPEIRYEYACTIGTVARWAGFGEHTPDGLYALRHTPGVLPPGEDFRRYSRPFIDAGDETVQGGTAMGYPSAEEAEQAARAAYEAGRT